MEMYWRVAAGIIAMLYVGGVAAEEAAPAAPPLPSEKNGTASASTSNSKPVIAMPDATPGDYWTYEVRDEIGGTVTEVRKVMVTEVTPKEIAMRFTVVGSERSGPIIYDRGWNVRLSGASKYSPNDGTGVELPLTVGKTWKIKSDEISSANGFTFKRTGSSRVTGQESITTKGGTFEAFVVETSYSTQNTRDPTRRSEVAARTWYSPDIDHWVKRAVTIRQGGHLMQQIGIELTAYGRKGNT